MPYDVTKGPKDGVTIKTGDNSYVPQEISAVVLQNLEKNSRRLFGDKSNGSCDNRSSIF